MGVSSTGGEDRRVNGNDEKLGLIEKAIQSFQHCTERMEDRFTRLEADVFTNKSKIRNNHDILQLIDSKLTVLEVRDERFDRVLNALERFLEDNTTNRGLRTEQNTELQLGKLMSITNEASVSENREHHPFMASSGTSTRSKKKAEHIVPTEKGRRLLQFPDEEINSVTTSTSSPGSKPVARGNVSLRTEENPEMELGMLMDSTHVVSVAENREHHSYMASSSGVTTRSRKNAGKLVAGEKCRRLLHFPEGINSVKNSNFSAGSKAASQGNSSNSSDSTSWETLNESAKDGPKITKAKRATKRKINEPSTGTGTYSSNIITNADSPEDFSVRVNRRDAVQGNANSVDVSIEDLNEDSSVQSSSGNTSYENLSKIAEAIPKIAKAKQATKRERNEPSTETGPDSGNKITRASRKSCQNLNRTAKAVPKILKTTSTTKRKSIASNTEIEPDSNSKITSSNSKPSPEKKGYRCRFCDKIFTNISAYKDDQRFHIMGPLKCHLCPFETTLMSYMRRHFNTQHPGCRPPDIPPHHVSQVNAENIGYKCPSCQKVFTSIHRYKDDQRFHVMGKLKCHLCSLEFKTFLNLKNHFKRAHPGCTPPEVPNIEVPKPDSNDRPFVCHASKCAKSYRSKQKLQEHLKYHAGEKYKCTLCDYESIWASNLRKHEQKFHRDTCQVNNSVSSNNAESLLQFSETTSKKQKSNRPIPKTKTKNNKLSKVPRQIKFPFTPFKTTDTKASYQESRSETDYEDTNSKAPANAPRPKLKRSVVASRKASSPKSNIRKPTSIALQSSLSNKQKTVNQRSRKN